MREFETGATRDNDDGKLDYEGFLSPFALRAYAEYMHGHRIQADGKLRDSDNWQKGIPMDAYMKSLFRHFMEAWLAHRGDPRSDMKAALCGILFNAFGYLHELTKVEGPQDVEDLERLNQAVQYYEVQGIQDSFGFSIEQEGVEL